MYGLPPLIPLLVCFVVVLTKVKVVYRSTRWPEGAPLSALQDHFIASSKKVNELGPTGVADHPGFILYLIL